jgi:hypothetical protein
LTLADRGIGCSDFGNRTLGQRNLGDDVPIYSEGDGKRENC